MDVRERSWIDDSRRCGEILVIIQRPEEAPVDGHEMTSRGELQITLHVPKVGEIAVAEADQPEVGVERDRDIAAKDALGDTKGGGVRRTSAADKGGAGSQRTDGHTRAITDGSDAEGGARVEIGESQGGAGRALQSGDAETGQHAGSVGPVKVHDIGPGDGIDRAKRFGDGRRPGVQTEPPVMHVDHGIIGDTIGITAARYAGGRRQTIGIVERQHPAALEIDVRDVGERAGGAVKGQAPFGPTFAQPVGGIVYAVDAVSVTFPRRRTGAEAEHVHVTGERIVGSETHIGLPLLGEPARARHHASEDQLGGGGDDEVALFHDRVVSDRIIDDQVAVGGPGKAEGTVEVRGTVRDCEEVGLEHIVPTLGAAGAARRARGSRGSHAVHDEIDRVAGSEPVIEQEAGSDIGPEDRSRVALSADLGARQVGRGETGVGDFDAPRDICRRDGHASRTADVRRDLMAEATAAFLNDELP